MQKLKREGWLGRPHERVARVGSPSPLESLVMDAQDARRGRRGQARRQAGTPPAPGRWATSPLTARPRPPSAPGRSATSRSPRPPAPRLIGPGVDAATHIEYFPLPSRLQPDGVGRTLSGSGSAW